MVAFMVMFNYAVFLGFIVFKVNEELLKEMT